MARWLESSGATDDPGREAFRCFFEEVDHPVSNTQPAPLLGQHNHELLAELGVTASEIAELEADGVIGQKPALHAVT